MDMLENSVVKKTFQNNLAVKELVKRIPSLNDVFNLASTSYEIKNLIDSLWDRRDVISKEAQFLILEMNVFDKHFFQFWKRQKYTYRAGQQTLNLISFDDMVKNLKESNPKTLESVSKISVLFGGQHDKLSKHVINNLIKGYAEIIDTLFEIYPNAFSLDINLIASKNETEIKLKVLKNMKTKRITNIRVLDLFEIFMFLKKSKKEEYDFLQNFVNLQELVFTKKNMNVFYNIYKYGNKIKEFFQNTGNYPNFKITISGINLYDPNSFDPLVGFFKLLHNSNIKIQLKPSLFVFRNLVYGAIERFGSLTFGTKCINHIQIVVNNYSTTFMNIFNIVKNLPELKSISLFIDESVIQTISPGQACSNIEKFTTLFDYSGHILKNAQFKTVFMTFVSNRYPVSGNGKSFDNTKDELLKLLLKSLPPSVNNLKIEDIKKFDLEHADITVTSMPNIQSFSLKATDYVDENALLKFVCLKYFVFKKYYKVELPRNLRMFIVFPKSIDEDHHNFIKHCVRIFYQNEPLNVAVYSKTVFNWKIYHKIFNFYGTNENLDSFI